MTPRGKESIKGGYRELDWKHKGVWCSKRLENNAENTLNCSKFKEHQTQNTRHPNRIYFLPMGTNDI